MPDAHRDRDFAGTPTAWSAGTDADTDAPDWDYQNGNLAAAPASGNAGSGHAVATESGSQGLDYDSVFFLWQTGPRGGQVPGIGLNIPVYVIGMVDGEGGRQLHDDVATHRSGMPPGGKRRLIWGGGSAAWINNEFRPPDTGGGVRLTASRAKMFVHPVDTYGRGSSCEATGAC